MVATKTIVIAGVITVICVTALVVGIVLGTRSYGCSISEPPTEVTVTHSATGTTISWVIPEGEEECEGAYRLGYEIDGGASVRQNFTDLEEELSWTIDPLQPCSVLSVHIWPITKDGEVMSEHFMEDFTVPLESLGDPTNMQINEEEGGLEVRWNAPANVGNCGSEIQYEVTVERDGESSTEDPSAATSYTIEDSSYCFEVTVSIVAIHEDETSAAITGTFQAPPIENIATLQSTDDPTQLVISWDPHPKADICGIEYRVVYRRGGQEFVVTAETATLSIELDYCVETELSVAAFNGEHSTEVGSSSGVIYPTQIDAVTDLTITEGVLSWTAPAVPETCTVTYVLNFDTDAGPTQSNTIETTYAVPENIYCFTYLVQVVPVLGEQSGTASVSDRHTDGSPVQNLQVETSSANSDQLTATWDTHPKESQCSLRYQITYTIEENVETWEEVENTVTFDKTYCVEGILSVTAINDNGARSNPAPYLVEEEDPTEIGTVSNVEIVDGLVTWTPISALGRCSVSYVLNVEADSGPDQYATSGASYLIPNTVYCFGFAVGVSTVVGSSSGESIFQNYRDDSGLENLQVVTSETDNDQLVATWTAHPKETQCSLRYQFTYTIGGTVISSPDLLVPTVTFDKVYCAEGTVSVMASNVDGLRSGETTVVVAAQNPATVDAVLNVVKDGEAITWDPVLVPERCTVVYVLNTNTDSGPGQYQTSDTSFIIPSADYCFTFIANIFAVAGETSSTPSMISVTDDSPVQNLQVETASANSDQLTATWDTHPKESQCSLRYQITYTIEENVETWEEVENTLTFDKTYCVEGILSVTAINDNGARSNPAPYLVEEEDPTEIGTVSNVQIVDGLVTWTPLSALGKCSVSYALNVNADSEGEVEYVTPGASYLIPSTDYCFSFAVGITAAVGSSRGESVLQNYRDDSGLENLQVVTSGTDNDQLVATWTAHPKQTQCSLQYEFTYTIGGNVISFQDLSVPTITFDKVYCAEGVVSVIASNVDGLRSGETIDTVPAQSPTDVGSVSNVQINDGVITWSPVSNTLESCTVIYTLNIVSDSETYQRETQDTTYSVPDSDYCFRFNVVVYASVGDTDGVSSSQEFTDGSPVQNLQVETASANSNQLIATWDTHPKESQCSLRYQITYTIEENVQTWEEVDNTLTFDKTYCVEGILSVTAINDNGARSNPAPYPVEEEDPTDIGSVSNIEIVDGRVTWTPISALGRCSISYVLNVETDTEPYQYQTSDAAYLIPSTTYCFDFAVRVIAVVGSSSGQSVLQNYRDDSGLENLQVVTSGTDNDQLVATWTAHPKETQCSLRYQFTYTIGGTVISSPDLLVPTVTFDKVYCAEGTVSVMASNADGLRSGETTVVVAAQNPATVDAVLNVVKDGEAITWDQVLVPERCTVVYVLNTNTDSGPEQYQTSDTSFIIPSVDYCFTFTANIVAVAGETSSTPSAISFIDDSGVGTLQVGTSETNDEQLTATWDAHPKAAQCSLQYALTYSVGGVVQHTDLVSENTVSFNRLFCVEGEVSVVATNNVDLNSSPSTTVVEAEYPSNVDPVTNLEGNDGDVTWTSISAPLGCEVTYILELSGDLKEEDYDTVGNTFTIPPADYCFEANVDVIAVIGTARSTPVAINIDAALEVGTIVVAPVLADNEILVSWPVHSKRDDCGITYDATYSYGSIENQAPILSDQETAVFSLGYCVAGTVTVTAVASVVTATASNTNTHPLVTPTAIGQVQDLTAVSTPDNEITVSWNPPPYVSQCANIEYEVTAADRTTPPVTSSCTPTTDSTSCVVTEYCPTTDITVIATYTDTINIIGETATHVYTCDTSSGDED